MVRSAVRSPVRSHQLTVETLSKLLQGLEYEELPSVPDKLKELMDLTQVADASLQEKKAFPGAVVARELARVWCGTVRRQLELTNANSRDWLIALAPIALHVAPLISHSRLRLKFTVSSREPYQRALELLHDADWVAQWLPSNSDILAEKIATQSYTQKTNFYDWVKIGIRYFVDAVELMSGDLEGGFPRFFEGFLPPLYEVPRPEVFALLQARISQALEADAWVALIGLGGIGKTSMLGAFLRSVDLGKQFDGGIVAFSGNPPMSADTDAGLLRPIVMRLCQQMSATSASIENLRSMLREHLTTRRALVIVDNVEHLQSLHWLRDIRGLTVLVSTRSVKQAEGLGINSDWQILLGALTKDEARELAVGISGCPPTTETDERSLAVVLDLVERYPLAIEIASRIAQRKGWEATQRLLSDVESRKLVLGYHDSASNAWVALEAVWDSLDGETQERLALLGSVPLLNRHDVAMGQAIWGVSHQVAEASFDRLAQYCLVQPMESGAYRMHALVWEMARHKLTGIPPEDVAAVKGWEWRYPIREVWSDWRWWRPCVPKPEDSGWALWDPSVPKTPKGEGFRWLLTIVKQYFWRTEDKIHVLADPLEWVVMHRRALPGKATMIAAMCAVILTVMFLSVATWNRAVLHASDEPFWTIAMVCLGLAVVFESTSLCLTIDQRRIAGWRVLGKSFTENLPRQE